MISRQTPGSVEVTRFWQAPTEEKDQGVLEEGGFFFLDSANSSALEEKRMGQAATRQCQTK